MGDSNLASALAPDISGPPAGVSAAAPALGATAQPTPPTPVPPEISGLPTAPASPVSDTLSPSLQPAQPAKPDLPRFQRTFGNTLKGILLGFEMGGVPGAVVGGADPQGVQRQANARAQAVQTAQHFADARAAHELAQAASLEQQVNAFNETHQQEMERVGLQNVKAAQDAGFQVVAVTPLDGSVADNSAAAMNNLQQIKNNNGGVVPTGLLHIHAGNANGIITLQLANPAAALDTINTARKAQGLPQVTQDQFLAQPATDRALQAKDALNFTWPTDVNGKISQDSVTTLQNRLALVNAQPEFNGKDALATKLQQNLDFQKAALQDEATRKGQAQGAQAQAAQPGETAAKVAEQTALAKTPQAQAQIAEAQARARQANAEADKALSEAGLGGLKPADPVIGYDPSGSAIMTNAKEAQGLNLHDVMKPDAAMVEKVTIARSYIALNNQLLADIAQLDKAGKIGGVASRWNEFVTGKLGVGDPDFEKFRVDLGLANTALMQFHVGNRGGSQMLEHFEDLANGKKMNAETLRAGIQAEGDYAAHRAMLTPTLAKQISGETLRQGPVAPMYGIQKSTGKPVQSLDGGKTWQLR